MESTPDTRPELDLFGAPIVEPPTWTTRAGTRRGRTVPAGSAARPGTGPAGRTCADCEWLCHTGRGGRYLKCELVRPAWTHGPKTDIRAKWAACAGFAERGEAVTAADRERLLAASWLHVGAYPNASKGIKKRS